MCLDMAQKDVVFKHGEGPRRLNPYRKPGVESRSQSTQATYWQLLATPATKSVPNVIHCIPLYLLSTAMVEPCIWIGHSCYITGGLNVDQIGP